MKIRDMPTSQINQITPRRTVKRRGFKWRIYLRGKADIATVYETGEKGFLELSTSTHGQSLQNLLREKVSGSLYTADANALVPFLLSRRSRSFITQKLHIRAYRCCRTGNYKLPRGNLLLLRRQKVRVATLGIHACATPNFGSWLAWFCRCGCAGCLVAAVWGPPPQYSPRRATLLWEQPIM